MLVARLEVQGAGERRADVRYRVGTGSTVRGLDGDAFDVIVIDFSRTGFSFIGDFDVPIGTMVSIGLSGSGLREAEVIWIEESCHGCRFVKPLATEQMAKAFRGQKHVMAELEAALLQRSVAGSEC
jgi:hypothetical protein